MEFDMVFTSFLSRDHCFDLINSQLRKFKKETCSLCKGAFYPLWEVDGAWLYPKAPKPGEEFGFQQLDESGIDTLDVESEYVYIDHAAHNHRLLGPAADALALSQSAVMVDKDEASQAEMAGAKAPGKAAASGEPGMA